MSRIDRLYLVRASGSISIWYCLMRPPNGVMSVTPGTCSNRGSMTQSWISRSCARIVAVALRGCSVQLADRRGQRPERRRDAVGQRARRAASRARPGARSSRWCRTRTSARRPTARRSCAIAARSRSARCSARVRSAPRPAARSLRRRGPGYSVMTTTWVSEMSGYASMLSCVNAQRPAPTRASAHQDREKALVQREPQQPAQSSITAASARPLSSIAPSTTIVRRLERRS